MWHLEIVPKQTVNDCFTTILLSHSYKANAMLMYYGHYKPHRSKHIFPLVQLKPNKKVKWAGEDRNVPSVAKSFTLIHQGIEQA